jgi:copper transport protein
MRRIRYVPAAALVAAVFAPAALAHAVLLRSQPADRSVLGAAPVSVRLTFDEPVRAAGGIEAVRNGGASVLAGKARTAGRVLVVPLRTGLPNGDYTVLWRVISDDGHAVEGVLAFGVGAGRAPPVASLRAGGGFDTADAVTRWLFLSGVLLAGGAAVFQLAVCRRIAGSRALAALLFAGFVLAVLGNHSHGGAASHTRFGHVSDAGLILAGIGAASASVAAFYRRVWPLPILCALGLLAVPTLRGHALDPGQPGALNVVADLAHVTAAAVWIGGVAALIVTGRRAYARRFSWLVAASLVVLGAGGIVRAWFELSAASQLWTTGYGQALLVKTGLLVTVLGLGWVNRSRLRAGGLAAELVLLAGVVGAVAVLTDLRPGRIEAIAAPVRAAAPSPPQLPPPGGIDLAQEDGPLAVAISVRPFRLTATVIGQDRNGVNGLAVAFRVRSREVRGAPCGSGCYFAALPASGLRAATVVVNGRSLRFALPGRAAPSATSLVGRATFVFRHLRSLVIDERLASAPGNAVRTRYEIVAPDRLHYRLDTGTAGIVIGARRWDRDSRSAPWQPSAQEPLRLPEPFWRSWRDASLLGSTRRELVVSFLDPTIPAWFTLHLDRRTLRTLDLHMTAGAHFMHHVYSGFNERLRIAPPKGF